MTPTISVVVPTYNRAGRLARLLRALDAQERGVEFEVVVADDGSTDHTVAVVEAAERDLARAPVLVRSATNTGPAGARNRGWRAASGDLIAFVDDDCVPEPTWLQNLIAAMADADVVVGRTRPPSDQVPAIGPFSAYLDVDHPDGYLTCNIAYRRSVLEQLDGFDELAFPLHNGEDTDLGLRAKRLGARTAMAADALVWHDVHPSSFLAHLRRVRHLEGIVRLVARHPQARQRPFHAGMFLRSADKGVLLTWAALAVARARPSPLTRGLLAASGAAYLWTWRRSYYRPRHAVEWVTAPPLGYLADCWAVVVMVRASVRHHTVLL